jgi:hypothetical protein
MVQVDEHCATSQKVAGLISNGVTGIFYCHTPSSHSLAQGLTQSVKEMSTRNISLGIHAAGA